MKKKLVIGLVVALTLTVGGGLAVAQWGYGGWGHMMGPGYGGYMMGPGHKNYANYCWGNGVAVRFPELLSQESTSHIGMIRHNPVGMGT